LCLHGLRHAAGFIQSKLADRLQTRFTPVVKFILDEGVKKSIEMTRLINEALGETAPATPDTQAGPTTAVTEADSADGPAEEGTIR
jgi:ribosome-binding factor A